MLQFQVGEQHFLLVILFWAFGELWSDRTIAWFDRASPEIKKPTTFWAIFHINLTYKGSHYLTITCTNPIRPKFTKIPPLST